MENTSEIAYINMVYESTPDIKALILEQLVKETEYTTQLIKNFDVLIEQSQRKTNITEITDSEIFLRQS